MLRHTKMRAKANPEVVFGVDLIKVNPQHMEVKLAPNAASNFLRHDDWEEVDPPKPNRKLTFEIEVEAGTPWEVVRDTLMGSLSLSVGAVSVDDHLDGHEFRRKGVVSATMRVQEVD